MTRLTFALTGAALASMAIIAAVSATAQDANSPRIAPMHQTDAPLLGFSITEDVEGDPDRASIGAGVTTQAATAVEAMRQNADAMTRVVRAVRSAGIAERDIQTGGVNLSPQYEYQQGQPPRLTGYQASNNVQVVTADIAGLGRLIDTLVSAGGNDLDGPTFFIADADSGMDDARANALRRAGERAMVYARAAGYRSARLVSINENGASVQPHPVMMARVALDVAAETPIQPGQVTRSLTLNVQYILER